jgi:clan AA aspartic protease
MILGSVLASGEAVVSVRMRGENKRMLNFRAVIDTGFNDWLTLTSEEIATLGLTFREAVRCLLADGSEIVSRIFTAEVEWMGAWKRVFVIEMEGEPLLGMAMLRGCHVGIDAVDGGRVEIRPLTLE